MKKLIKLLFPKTYQAILDDSYNQAYAECNGNYDNHDDYDYNYHDYTDQYEQDELQRLHDEHYARIAEDQYQLELTRLHEEECQGDEQMLAKLYSPKVSLLSVGDKIHLHSRQGMYTVTAVNKYAFAYRTRDSIDDRYADYNDYKCHAGGKWNNKGE